MQHFVAGSMSANPLLRPYVTVRNDLKRVFHSMAHAMWRRHEYTLVLGKVIWIQENKHHKMHRKSTCTGEFIIPKISLVSQSSLKMYASSSKFSSKRSRFTIYSKKIETRLKF